MKNIKGLTASEVDERVEKKQVNFEVKVPEKSNFKILFDNFFTFYNILFIIILMLYLTFNVRMTNYFFMIIVLINLAIAIFQEIKTKYKLRKLRLTNIAMIPVLRENNFIEIESSKIVLDDIIKIKIGDEIPIDGEIVYGEISVNESILTGESRNVYKKIGDKVLAGSYIVSGECLVITQKVSGDRFISNLLSKAKAHKKPKSKLLNSITLITKILGVFVVPLGIAIFFITVGGSTLKMQTAGNMMVGMIPAGMLFLSSVTLASGIVKLSTKNVLVHDLYSIENLARVDMLCLDKTGTITDGTMSINKVDLIDKNINVEKLMSSYNAAVSGTNSTSSALIDKFGSKADYSVSGKLDFSSDRKYSAVKFNEFGTFVLGAYEYINVNSKNKTIENKILKYSESGFRVLALVKVDDFDFENENISLNNIEIKALIVIEDTIRAEAKDTIKWFKDNGVGIKIISGDNAITVSNIAKRVGVEGYEKFISLEGLSLDKVKENALKFNIFGRVTPEQKAVIIQELKANGYTTGMTGDGVNDILAMKQADCSIAMASGSAATKSVSNLVLLDSNFASMPAAVFEGRRVINNIERTSILYVLKGIFVFLLSLSSIIIGVNYPFNEFGYLIIFQGVIEAYATFLLALEPNAEILKGSFLKNVIKKALPYALYMLITVLIAGSFTNFNAGIMALIMNISGYVILFRICSPFKGPYRKFVFISSLILGILVSLIAPSMHPLIGIHLTQYNLFTMKLNEWLVVGGIFLSMIPLYYIVTRIFKNIFNSKGFEKFLDKIEKNKI